MDPSVAVDCNALLLAEVEIEQGIRRGRRLTMKTLRAGFGCRYAGRVPAQVLQKLMRHANIKTTMDYYANVDDAVMEAVLGRERNSPRNNAGDAVASTSAGGDITR